MRRPAARLSANLVSVLLVLCSLALIGLLVWSVRDGLVIAAMVVG